MVASTSRIVNETKSSNQEKMEIEFSDDESDDIIESSQPEENYKPIQKTLSASNHEAIMEIMKAIDGDIESVTTEDVSKATNKRKETVIVIEDESINATKESASKIAKTSIAKMKITDYFCKLDQPK